MTQADGGDVSLAVARILNEVGLRCGEYITAKKPPIYNVGGCGCGAAPDVQIYYDGEKLAIVPPIILGVEPDTLREKRDEIREAISVQYPGLSSIDIVCSDGEYPEYLQKLRRR